MKKREYPLFSNGTEAEIWTRRNCERCIKGTFYNEKLGRFPKYRCAVQMHIDAAWIGDGRGNERTYKAVRQDTCPYIKTEWHKSKKKKKEIKGQLRLDL